MEPILIGVIMFIVVVLGPICGAEDRPDFLRADRRHRLMVGTWFRLRNQ